MKGGDAISLIALSEHKEVNCMTVKKYVKKNGETAWMYKLYLGRDSVTGKEKSTTRRGFKTKREAIIDRARLQLKFKDQGTLSETKMTFNELYELWLEQYKKNVRPTTLQRVKIYFNNHILKIFGSLKIHRITPLFCQDTLNQWFDSGLKTYRKMRTYTSEVFKYGMLIGVISDNPMERTVIPKMSCKDRRKDEDCYYTKEELKEFLRCLLKLKDKRAYTFFRLLGFGGFRKGEAMAILWDDVNFEEHTIAINKTLVEMSNGDVCIQDTKTESSTRVVKMDKTSMDILKSWKSYVIQERLKHGIGSDDFNELPVFCNSISSNKNQYLYKSYPNNVMKKVQKHFPDMKIIKVHDFRRTNASLFFESGASIKDVSHRLGHKSTRTTMDIYIKVTIPKQNEAVDTFEKYMAF